MLFILLMIDIWLSAAQSKSFSFNFGPKYNDQFLTKSVSGCSKPYRLPSGFQFGGQPRNELFVCVFGVVTFDSPMEDNYDPNNFESSTTAMIAPFYADSYTVDNLLDSMCNLTVYSYPSDYLREPICDFYTNGANSQTFYFKTRATREEEKTYNKSYLSSITSDDDFTKDIYGIVGSEDPNLFNNVFKREMSFNDHLDANVLLQNHIQGFSCEWGYVVTWNKVAAYPGILDAFNSFQMALVCGIATTSGTQKRCFAIFHFIDLQWTISHFGNQSQGISGFNNGNGA